MRFPVSQEEIIDAVDAEYRRQRERDEFLRFLDPPPPRYEMELVVAKAFTTVALATIRLIAARKRKRKQRARR